MDWDGASGATMIFKNSYGYMGNVWSHWNVGIYNVPSGQTLNFNLVKITGWENGDTNTSLGGSYSTIYSKNATVLPEKRYRYHQQFVPYKRRQLQGLCRREINLRSAVGIGRCQQP